MLWGFFSTQILQSHNALLLSYMHIQTLHEHNNKRTIPAKMQLFCCAIKTGPTVVQQIYLCCCSPLQCIHHFVKLVIPHQRLTLSNSAKICYFMPSVIRRLKCLMFMHDDGRCWSIHAQKSTATSHKFSFHSAIYRLTQARFLCGIPNLRGSYTTSWIHAHDHHNYKNLVCVCEELFVATNCSCYYSG